MVPFQVWKGTCWQHWAEDTTHLDRCGGEQPASGLFSDDADSAESRDCGLASAQKSTSTGVIRLLRRFAKLSRHQEDQYPAVNLYVYSPLCPGAAVMLRPFEEDARQCIDMFPTVILLTS
jgi:hypothetical protein